MRPQDAVHTRIQAERSQFRRQRLGICRSSCGVVSWSNINCENVVQGAVGGIVVSLHTVAAGFYAYCRGRRLDHAHDEHELDSVLKRRSFSGVTAQQPAET